VVHDDERTDEARRISFVFLNGVLCGWDGSILMMGRLWQPLILAMHPKQLSSMADFNYSLNPLR